MLKLEKRVSWTQVLFAFSSVRSPEMPQYSINNLNPMPSLSMPNSSLLGGQSVSLSDLDMSTTIASQAGLSGGNMQYTPVTSQQVLSPPQPQPVNPAPALTLNQQTLQMLAQSGLFSSQTSQPNSVVQPQQGIDTAASNQAADTQQQQNELLKQLLFQMLTNQAQQQQVNQPAVTVQVSAGDPNMQSVDMPSLNSLDQNIIQSLMTGESPMTSLGAFNSFDGLSGPDLDCDPNVAGFETVGGDTNVAE